MFMAALFTIAKIWKQPKCPSSVDERRKNCGTFTQWNNTQPYKRKSYLLLQHGWTKNIMLSEISQSEKDKYHMICGI